MKYDLVGMGGTDLISSEAKLRRFHPSKARISSCIARFHLKEINSDNPHGAITYFKTENSDVMLEKIQPLIDLLDKYDIPYDIVYTNYVGKIIYEGDYQVGVIDT